MPFCIFICVCVPTCALPEIGRDTKTREKMYLRRSFNCNAFVLVLFSVTYFGQSILCVLHSTGITAISGIAQIYSLTTW